MANPVVSLVETTVGHMFSSVELSLWSLAHILTHTHTTLIAGMCAGPFWAADFYFLTSPTKTHILTLTHTS